MTVLRRPRGHGRAEQHLVLGDPTGTGEPVGEVDLGRTQHAGFDERLQRVHRRWHAETKGTHATPSANSASSATTVAAGGRHWNTPYGRPSACGVWAPTMPRTNR